MIPLADRASALNAPPQWAAKAPLERFDNPSESELRWNAEIKRLNRLRLRVSLVAGLAFVLVTLLSDRSTVWMRGSELGGFLLIVASLGGRLWALGCIDGNKKEVLVTWGPYRYLRHPLYCSSMLFALGTCLALGSVMATLMLLPILVCFYLPPLHAEERFLAARFGVQWEAYCATTGLAWPKFGARPCENQRPFHLRRPAREIGTLLFLPLAAYSAAALIDYFDQLRILPDWFF